MTAEAEGREGRATAGAAGARSVVMMCYAFPPAVVAGAVRSAAFAAGLPAEGWRPTVLTVRDARDPALRARAPASHELSSAVVRTPEWNLSGVMSLIQGVVNRPFKIAGRPLTRNYLRELVCVPDEQIAWQSTVRGCLLARRSDVIYVSCSPFSSAISGAWVKRWSGKPLVVDFRDAWSLNSHAHWSPYQRWWIEKLERYVVRTCDKLVVNTWSAERAYRRLYPQHAEKLVTIPNGYDELTPAFPNRAASPFKVVHIGNFYGNRSPDSLLKALRALSNPDIEFVHVGVADTRLTEAARTLRITNVGPVGHAQALQHARGAHLLYLKQGHEPGVSAYLAVASKTYEYLATGLPILADCPPGDNLDLVRKYASRAYIVDSDDPELLRAQLEAAYQERGTTTPRISEAFVNEFARRALTAKLARVLDSVAPSPEGTR